jgi:hypothetical protein
MTITFDEYVGLSTGRIARIHQARASCQVEGKGDDSRFVMRGPSGTHSLLVSATPHGRLVAHWKGFCGDPRNQY